MLKKEKKITTVRQLDCPRKASLDIKDVQYMYLYS